MQVMLPSSADVASAIAVWSESDARLGQLLARYGEAAPALRHYGLVLWESGNVQGASHVLAAAVALRPEDARVWHDLSSVFNALGRRGEAAACAEASLARDATQATLWLNLGSIRGAMGERTASIEAFEKAVALNDGLVDAWIGLGIACLQARLFEKSTAALLKAVERGRANDPTLQACLGEALRAMGDFTGSARAFTIASDALPDNRGLFLKRGRAQFLVDAIERDPAAAVAALERLSFSEAEIEKTIHDAFHLLSAYDHGAAAIRIGQYRLARAPDDPMQSYLLAALQGDPMERAPDAYIVSFFDRFAADFDEQLVNVLDYNVPAGLADLVRQSGRPAARVLDLGCGTGLAGPFLAQPGRALTGVDLSPRMLEKARKIGCYETLVEAEVVAFLATGSDTFDLVIAADLLIYFGGLAPLFDGVARRLEPGGLWALSVETIDGGDYLHLPSGRFAHSLSYVEREATRSGLNVVRIEPTIIRLDANKPARGALLLLSKCDESAAAHSSALSQV